MQNAECSQAAEFALGHGSRFGGNEVAEAVGGIIATVAVFDRVNLEHILRPIRIVLQRRQALNEAGVRESVAAVGRLDHTPEAEIENRKIADRKCGGVDVLWELARWASGPVGDEFLL